MPPVFAPLVDAARQAGPAFGRRQHSTYLYGSTPRGTARPGVSGHDMLLALRDEPGDTDKAAARRVPARRRYHRRVRGPSRKTKRATLRQTPAHGGRP